MEDKDYKIKRKLFNTFFTCTAPFFIGIKYIPNLLNLQFKERIYIYIAYDRLIQMEINKSQKSLIFF